jgi:hypothetical protein
VQRKIQNRLVEKLLGLNMGRKLVAGRRVHGKISWKSMIGSLEYPKWQQKVENFEYSQQSNEISHSGLAPEVQALVQQPTCSSRPHLPVGSNTS